MDLRPQNRRFSCPSIVDSREFLESPRPTSRIRGRPGEFPSGSETFRVRTSIRSLRATCSSSTVAQHGGLLLWVFALVATVPFHRKMLCLASFFFPFFPYVFGFRTSTLSKIADLRTFWGNSSGRTYIEASGGLVCSRQVCVRTSFLIDVLSPFQHSPNPPFLVFLPIPRCLLNTSYGNLERHGLKLRLT